MVTIPKVAEIIANTDVVESRNSRSRSLGLKVWSRKTNNGLAHEQDAQVFLPIHAEDMSPDHGRRVRWYNQLVDDAVDSREYRKNG